ncbi:VOC family protein [Mesorhizobium sp. YR577]|uniref:VOC family protein n=1 Tax=Mesorhizobium sp. YR577 TaxID=1884373 RepID=UPI0008F0BD37|nr:VOC family protein [Mesorhizobium sp. YR577]SFU17114.1 lactoylglutathione lyase [Mesorhizobium sp. YR577]
MLNFESLAHIAVRVKNIDRSLAFYTNILNMPELMRLHHPDGSLFLIYLRVTDTQYIELFPNAEGDTAPQNESNGLNHFCLTVEDLEVTMKEFVARGGKSSKWADTPGGGRALIEVEQPFIGVGLDGNRQCWIRDPDGNRIELMQMSKDSMQYKAIRGMRGYKAGD